MTPEPFVREIAAHIQKRRMETPALFFLEMYKPLTGVCHALSLGSRPLLAALFGTKLTNQVEKLLESSANIEMLCKILEHKPRSIANEQL